MSAPGRDIEDAKARVEAALADYGAAVQEAIDWYQDWKIANCLDTVREPAPAGKAG